MLNSGGGISCLDLWEGTGINPFIKETDLIQLCNKFRKIKGTFCFGKIIGGNVILSVDIIGSIPLYYSLFKQKIYVSQNAHEIAAITQSGVSDNVLSEFKKLSYVTDENTVYDGIYQVQPGEIVKINADSGDVEKVQYYTLDYNYVTNGNADILMETWHEVLKTVVIDMSERIGKRAVVVPLSGGCDSRTIAVMLKEAGISNVICVAYGRKDSKEDTVSRQVAEALGYQWIFAEYSKDTNERLYRNYIEDFLHFSCRGSNLGCTQAFMAFEYLTKNRLIPDDSVVVPGHALDFLAGSHIKVLEKDHYDRNELVDYIYKKHYNLNNKERRPQLKWGEKIPDKITKADFLKYYVAWEWRNRQSKFIANDVRTYEFFGLSYELPFWDIRCCDFWSNVGYDLLINRKLQYLYTSKYIDPVAGLRINYFDTIKVLGSQKIKDWLKKNIWLFRQLSAYRECMVQYDKNVICAYDLFDREEYRKKLWNYGLGYNMNTENILIYINRIMMNQGKI